MNIKFELLLRIFQLILLFAISLTFQGISQLVNIKFDQISIEQGLSQSTAYAITQDALGFIWFGTADGLNRYDGYSVKVFKHNSTDSNSISNDRVNCLLSDSRGDLWIGTSAGGVDRYVLTANRFLHNLHNEQDSSSISDNRITALFEDNNGWIWVGTRNGLNHYNPSSGEFIRYYFNSKVNLNGNSINAICEDDENNIWIGTSNGLYRMNNNEQAEFTRLNNLNVNPKTPYGDDVTTLHIDFQGNVLVGTFGQTLKQFDKKSNSFLKYQKSGETIRAIYEDSEGNLWLAPFYSDLRILNRKKRKSNEIENVLPIVELKNQRIYSMFEDKTGILWIGTWSSGVFVYNKNSNHFKHYLNNPVNPTAIYALCEDKDKELWIGTYNKGLKRFNKERDKIKTYLNNPQNPNSLSSNIIMSLYESSDGYIWIGTLNGGLNRFDKSTGKFKRYKHPGMKETRGLSNNDITALFEDSKKNLWIGNGAGSIDKLNLNNNTIKHLELEGKKPNTLGEQSVTVIREDINGVIWVGTTSGELYKIIPMRHVTDQYSIEGIKLLPNLWNNKIQSNIIVIQSLYIQNPREIWIGTSRTGLMRFYPEDKSSKFFTVEDGLPDNVIYGILADINGNLWLSTNNGISRYNPENNSFKNYDVNDGLQSNEFNTGAYFISPRGEFFFGGINGFNAFFPSNIDENKIIPSVYVTNFKIFDKAIPLPDPITKINEIELSYFQNFFSFEFVALNYTAPEKNQYAYILKGFDKAWHFVTAQQRYASYTNLDPGEYVLHVKASNNDGVWNETGASISIIITPPFWMTWWFKVLFVLTFISIGVFIYYRRVKTLEQEKVLQQEISKRILEKQEEERSRIALEMHDVLGQDLLLIKNRLLLSIPKIEDNSITSEYLNDISEDVSKVLKTVREISHNLRPPDLDQLGLTEALRSILHTMRKSTSINVAGNIDSIDGLIRVKMEINLVRIVQEAIGNIIKHSEATECRLDITNKHDMILIEISDNGKGFDLYDDQGEGKYHHGLGLVGMTERVRILEGTFDIDSEIRKGTRIKITIPVKQLRN